MMVKTLLLFILSCIRLSITNLRIAILRALLPRMPLPNWRKDGIIRSVDDPASQVVEYSRIRTLTLWKKGK